jgi:hypothetical protein
MPRGSRSSARKTGENGIFKEAKQGKRIMKTKTEWPLIGSYYEYLQRLQPIRDTRQSNSRGTAFYLAGMQPSDDRLIDQKIYPRIISWLIISDTPIAGWLAVWQRPGPNGSPHVGKMGIVARTSPEPMITLRNHEGGPLHIEIPLPEANGESIYHQFSIKYYEPAEVREPLF